MIEQEYNGWTNYPTWAAFNTISSKPELAAMAALIANRSDTRGIDRDDALKDWIESGNPLRDREGKGLELYKSLLQWAISNINWTELEKAFNEENK